MRKWVPKNHQKRAVKFLVQHPGAALFMDPGLGKTSSVLAALKVLQNKGLVRKVLVVAPVLVCHGVWPVEIQEWLEFNHFTFTLLHGSKKNQNLHEDVTIYIINPEGLEWFNEVKGMQIIKPDTLVIDESTKFKSWQSGRFKILKPWLPRFKRRWILSGGPTPNSIIDIFSQMYIVDLGASLGKYITHFKNKFFVASGFGGYTWVLTKGSDKKIYKLIKPRVLRMSAGDYLELPTEVHNPIYLELPNKARKMYDSMENELFSDLNKSTSVSAVNNGVASMKCRQIASGAIYKDRDLFCDEEQKKGVWKALHKVKIEKMKDLVESLNGSPVLILYYFKHELERLHKAFGKNIPNMSNCPPSQVPSMQARWNNNEIPILFGHPDSMGHGLNLQHGDAQHIIFFSLTWNYDSFMQVIRRLRRQGSKHSRIFVHMLLMKDTIEFIMYQVLKFKGNRQQKLLMALEKYRKSRK